MEWVTLLVTIAGAIAGLSTLIIFFVNRHDGKKKNVFTPEDREMIKGMATSIDVLSGKVCSLEQDTSRLQLLNLIQNDGDNKDAILTLGHHYFQDLKGNMYMTELYTEWARRHEIDEKVLTEIIHRGKNDV